MVILTMTFMLFYVYYIEEHTVENPNPLNEKIETEV